MGRYIKMPYYVILWFIIFIILQEPVNVNKNNTFSLLVMWVYAWY
mgnify:CR=1 FL=1